MTKQIDELFFKKEPINNKTPKGFKVKKDYSKLSKAEWNNDSIIAGWGACSRSGCPCQHFEGNAYSYWVCTNCGHNYSDHW
ncbi:MAG TPA: hypothetical protein VIK89_02780 [Cytophagaceae bacterium]